MKYVPTTCAINQETTAAFWQEEMASVSSSILPFLGEANDRTKKKIDRTSLVGAGPLLYSVIETAQPASLSGCYKTLEELGSLPGPAAEQGLSYPREGCSFSGKEDPTPNSSRRKDSHFYRFWRTITVLVTASIALSFSST